MKDHYIQSREECFNKALEIKEKIKNPNKKKEKVQEGGNKKKKEKKDDGEDNGGGDDDKDSDDELKKALENVIIKVKPDLKFKDVAGLEKAKEALKEAIILPIQFPKMYETMKIDPHKGILMYGPPGTGKSFLAKACAGESDCTFLSVSSSDLMSKYQGESERLIKTLFQMARDAKPSIIFIDEIDSLCGTRGEGQSESSRRVLTEFLVQMQGVGNDMKGVLVLGATNLPWGLDSAIRRRFVKRVLIPLPDVESRKQIITMTLKNSMTLSNEQIEDVANRTEGYNASDVVNMLNDAKYAPLRLVTSAK